MTNDKPKRKPGRPKGAFSGPRDAPAKIAGKDTNVLLKSMIEYLPPWKGQSTYQIARRVLHDAGTKPTNADTLALARAYEKVLCDNSYNKVFQARYKALIDQHKKAESEWLAARAKLGRSTAPKS